MAFELNRIKFHNSSRGETLELINHILSFIGAHLLGSFILPKLLFLIVAAILFPMLWVRSSYSGEHTSFQTKLFKASNKIVKVIRFGILICIVGFVLFELLQAFV
jgi:hypothetical protein